MLKSSEFGKERKPRIWYLYEERIVATRVIFPVF